MNVGDRIKQLRTEKNLTQPQLAEAIGIEQSYLSKLENDKSVPSAEIFQAILKGLVVDVGTFLHGIDEAIIRNQLKQIPEVALYLSTQTSLRVHNIKKWLLGSALACTVGLTLIVAGYKSLLFNTEYYEYISGGIIKSGEPKDLYANPFKYFMSNGCPFEESNFGSCKDTAVRLGVREQVESLLLSSYQGTVIYKEVKGGERAFYYRQKRDADNTLNRWLMLLGTLLAFGGLFGFIVEYRLRKI